MMYEPTDGNTALHARDILAGVVDLAIQSLQKIIGSRQTDPIKIYRLEHSKTQLEASGITAGPIFRRLWKQQIAPPAAVGEIV